MKNFKIKLLIPLIIAIIGIITFQSCDNDIENQINKSVDDVESSKVLYNTYVDDLLLPDGTIATRIDDSTVKFVYPKGVELWSFSNNGLLTKAVTSSYTCNCSAGSGCNVFYSSRTGYGCSHGSCSGDCTGSHSDTSNQNKNIFGINPIFVDTNQKIEPIVNDTDFDTLPYIPENVLKEKTVQNILKIFAKSIYGKDYLSYLEKVDISQSNKSNIDDIIFVEMKLYGYKFIYGISFKNLSSEIANNNNFEKAISSKFSCNCNSGSTGCIAGSSLGVKYCEGGSCSSCTMTVGSSSYDN